MSAIAESTAHYHSPDDGCLSAMPAVWLGEVKNESEPVMVPRAGWWQCTRLTGEHNNSVGQGDLAGTIQRNLFWYPRPNGYLLHEHGPSLIAHLPKEPCGFPGGAE